MFEAVVACFTYTFGIISLNKFKNLLDFPKELEKRVYFMYMVGFDLVYFADVLFNSQADIQCTLLFPLYDQKIPAHL